MDNITLILLMAGKGSRLNLGYNKTLCFLDEKMMYEYSLEKFIEIGIKNILLVTDKNSFEQIKLKQENDNIKVVLGGNTRQESVYNALKYVITKKVIIHDAARPFISRVDILNFLNAFENKDALILADKMTDSIKQITNINSIKHVDRNDYIKALTPQGFMTSEIIKAHELGKNDSATDDAFLYEKYINKKIDYIFITKQNNKITTPLDLYPEYKIGHSFDIHRLGEYRKLVLGGVKIDYHLGLIGHSDADCVLHAIIEAMLGVIGKSDIGDIFPDTDNKYKDIDSSILLNIVKKEFDLNYSIEHIDCMIYLEQPKIKDYKQKIKENIKELLNLDDINKISLKATTLEKFELPIGKSISSECFILARKNNR